MCQCVCICARLSSLSLSASPSALAPRSAICGQSIVWALSPALSPRTHIYTVVTELMRMWNVLCLFAHEGAQQPREGQGQVQKVRAPLNQSCSDEYTASRDPITQEHKWKCCTNIKLARQSGGAAALALSILAAQTWSAVSPEETTTPESADTNVAQTRWCPHALLQKNFSISKSRLGTSLNFWANS